MVTWNLSDIVPAGGEAKLIGELCREVAKFRSFRRRLKPNIPSDEFMDILFSGERIEVLCSRLGAYAGLRIAENTSDPARTAHEAHVSQLCTEADNETMFFRIWFRDLPARYAARYVKAAGRYRYMLQRIRAFRKHTLPEGEEQIINLKDLTGVEAQSKLYDVITGRFRYLFMGRRLTYDEISQHKFSPTRSRRKAAYLATLRRFQEEGDVLGQIYRAIVSDVSNECVKLRGYRSPMSAANLSNDLPDAAVDSLISVVRGNRGVFHQFFRLKARICGLDNMDRFDLYAPYPHREMRRSYFECVKITLDVFREFDETAHSLAKKVFDEDHVHSHPAPYKQPGAFCHPVFCGATPYLMLNHVGGLEDLYTMVHETGHAVHALAAQNQTEYTYLPGLPLAETASIFAETLLTERLIGEASGSEKAAHLVRQLDRQYASITRQVYFTLFEEAAYEAVPQGASTDDLDEIYLKNLREQFGSSVHVPDIFRHEWKSIPHLYHSPFYCYSYAFGSLLILSLHRMYRTDPASFTPKYMRMLSMGGSACPAEILREVGVDISKKSFWRSGFDAIADEIRLLRRLTT